MASSRYNPSPCPNRGVEYSYPLIEAHAGLGAPNCPPLQRVLLAGVFSSLPETLLRRLPSSVRSHDPGFTIVLAGPSPTSLAYPDHSSAVEPRPGQLETVKSLDARSWPSTPDLMAQGFR
jgi:hypothetical protein